MRVVLFTDTLGDINGVSRFIRDIAEHARERGHDLHVVTATRVPVAPAPNLHVLRPRAAMAMPRYPDLELAWPPAGLGDVADALRPDIVHVSTPGPVGLTGRGFAIARGLPLVGVYHTDFPAYIEHLVGHESLVALSGWAMRKFYAPFARVLTRSEAYRPRAMALGLAGGRVRALRPGVRSDRFVPGTRAGGEGPVKFLYVGRVSTEKNLGLLARAWAMAREELGSGASLTIVGDGPFRAELEGLMPGVTFTGFLTGTALSAAYAGADVFVFPSATDTLGQVVLEAMASGLPAMVSDKGGPCGLVEHGRTGLVLAADDARAWAGAMVTLARDPGAQAAMGRAARGWVESHTTAGMFDDFWGTHREVLAGAGGGAEPLPLGVRS